MARPLTVIVYSDYICPFCFIASQRVERLGQEMGVGVDWRGLEIHPETPPQGVPTPPHLRRYLEDEGGSVQGLAQEDEIELRVPSLVSNSHLALLAGEFARGQGKFPEYHQAVFRAYFQEGQDIGQKSVLEGLLKGLGLDSGGLEAYLARGDGEKVLEANRHEALHRGIGGVPTFLIGAFQIEGVQAYPVLMRAVERSRGQAT